MILAAETGFIGLGILFALFLVIAPAALTRRFVHINIRNDSVFSLCKALAAWTSPLAPLADYSGAHQCNGSASSVVDMVRYQITITLWLPHE